MQEIEKIEHNIGADDKEDSVIISFNEKGETNLMAPQPIVMFNEIPHPTKGVFSNMKLLNVSDT